MTAELTQTTQQTHELTYRRGHETYSWIWTPGQLQGTLRTVGQAAADPQLSLGWGEARHITHAMRMMTCCGIEATEVKITDGCNAVLIMGGDLPCGL